MWAISWKINIFYYRISQGFIGGWVGPGNSLQSKDFDIRWKYLMTTKAELSKIATWIKSDGAHLFVILAYCSFNECIKEIITLIY